MCKLLRLFLASGVLICLCYGIAIGTTLTDEVGSSTGADLVERNLLPLAEITAVATGSLHTCALTQAGALLCWGANRFGQLGDGTTVANSMPVLVVGLARNIAAITAGGRHSCALTTNGDVLCWGSNQHGQLGDGTNADRHTPTAVVGLMSSVVAIAAGQDHTCALTAVGSVYCWGLNSDGQLGDSTILSQHTPVVVDGLGGAVTAVVAGASHTCVLTAVGGVKCWGLNGDGQLGDNTRTRATSPVDVDGLAANVTAIAAGSRHSCALTNAGTLKCWGWNIWGQLGDGSEVDASAPVDVVGITSTVLAIDAGFQHTCATTATSVYCWGRNHYGQLGDGTTNATPMAGDAIDVGGAATALAVGDYHACVVTAVRGVKCWGWNADGQLGDGSNLEQSTPTTVHELMTNSVAVAGGEVHACALTTAGGVKCWGSNGAGQLGNGTTLNASATPTDVQGLSSGVVAIATGQQHTCALTTAGGVKCWGANGSGQLGDGTNTSKPIPVDVVNLTSGVAAIATGQDHTCALTTAGAVKCWGWNNYGQLGIGSMEPQNSPVAVLNLDSVVSAIAVGSEYSCALTTAGGIKCWGKNAAGELGDGSNEAKHEPVDVMGLGSGVVALSAATCCDSGEFDRGNGHTCAVTTSGAVKCWGWNRDGQLGDGTKIDRNVPVDVIGLANGVRDVAAGEWHTCALLITGGINCWGSNNSGQLGNGSTIDSSIPVTVVGLNNNAITVTAGGWHNCLVTTAGSAQCWGWKSLGQLGDGSVWRVSPTDVVQSLQKYLPIVLQE